MVKIIFYLSFLFSSLSLLSQGGGDQANFGGGSAWSSQSLGNRLFVDGLDGKFSSDKLYSDTKGNPYLTEEAVSGTLVLNKSNKITKVPILYNLYTKEIIVTDKEGNEHFLNKDFCQEFILPLDGKDIHFKKVHPKFSNQFYEVLFQNGVTTFFKERYVTRKNAVKNGVNDTPAKFNRRVRYFMIYGTGELKEVKLKKKEMFSGFSKQEISRIEKFIKTNKVKLRNESDYVDLFNSISI